MASGFGGASSVVILLVWVYYSAQIFLMGAEVTWVYAHLYGSRKGEPRPAAARDVVPHQRPAGVDPATASLRPTGQR